jgi:hypothetical protein
MKSAIPECFVWFGLFLLYSANASSALDKPMTFSLQQECEGSGCNSYILAQGTIVEKTPLAFEAFMSRIDHKPIVYFHSPGGSLAAGIKLGLLVRKFRLDTFVGGPYEKFVEIGRPYAVLVNRAVCYSACVYAFLGGVTRELKKGGQLGVHQFRGIRGDTGEASAQITTTVLANYIDAMGVDRRLLDIASTTGSDNVYSLSETEARQLNVDNTSPPLARWRLEAANDGTLLLVASQKQARRDGTTHLILQRDRGSIIATVVYQIRQNFRSVKEMTEIFSGKTSFEIAIGKKDYRLLPVSDWKSSGNRYSITLKAQDSVLDELAKVRGFVLQADWPNALRDVDPSVAFGTEGFDRGVVALRR